MERRTFLKNILGAAIVATMPKIVVDQIEAIPPETITPVEPVKTEDISDQFWTEFEKILYIYDNNKLVAASTVFYLEITRPTIDMGEFFLPGLWEWKIAAEKLRWFNGCSGINYFAESNKLNCLVLHKELKVQGEVFITECAVKIPDDSDIEEDIVFTGSGTLIVEANDNTAIKEHLRTAQGAEIPNRKIFKISKRGIKG
jgi:hypothetical protein